jgi:hypothetical protein
MTYESQAHRSRCTTESTGALFSPAGSRRSASRWSIPRRQAAWLDAYREHTPWDTDVMEIRQDALTYLFDAAPTLTGADSGDDRVVAVWGHSRLAKAARDRGRQRGFIPNPPTWSQAGRDRGHFVAHAAGGGMDMNFFPQGAGLNRGTSDQGKVWKAMERYAVGHPGTALFVRPTYDGPTWVPATLEYGLLIDDRLWCEQFENHD